MMQMALWNESSYQLWTAALVNHIWQSTVVALIVWLLVPTLRVDDRIGEVPGPVLASHCCG